MASQVIEHLAPRALVEFLGAARRALGAGGVLICETINPQSLFALANWYVMDLTHSQPIHPHALAFLVEEAGFDNVEVRYLSPARPPREPVEVDADAPAWARTLGKTVDEELGGLTDVVFGLQDYALIARVV
jgi:O-antigen chain-terminating methyltransferase